MINTMTLFNGTTQNQLLMSSFEKPIIFTMIGSTIANTMDSQIISQNMLPSNVTPIQTERMNSLNSDTVCFGNENSSSESFLSMITEDSQISSHFMNSTSLSNAPQITHTFDPINYEINRVGPNVRNCITSGGIRNAILTAQHIQHDCSQSLLTSTADATPVTQATNISALSEMSDAELLCFINPATFDQIR
ncbi:unnamed protein product [Medioppia subpectinata]|uniref:Uncharacterized protein n=1 Tax=Medioppia subpectinata TaxID=1979941 RepID=A0A7R9PTQ4_9ACAR|nr:unnamed protein product [Medioppia subpectinata]CAG2099996.1 unnamed protein product [Medioppia subpectinata]